MSQENVEFARSVFSRWNAGERSFPDEEIHPDVVLVSRILGKAVRGRAGVRAPRDLRKRRAPDETPARPVRLEVKRSL